MAVFHSVTIALRCCYYVAMWILACSKWFGLGGCQVVVMQLLRCLSQCCCVTMWLLGFSRWFPVRNFLS